MCRSYLISRVLLRIENIREQTASLKSSNSPHRSGIKLTALTRATAQRPMVALEELQRFTAYGGEFFYRMTFGHALHKYGLQGKLTRTKAAVERKK